MQAEEPGKHYRDLCDKPINSVIYTMYNVHLTVNVGTASSLGLIQQLVA